MSRAGVRVDGARELRASLKRAGDDLDDLKTAHAQIAAYVAAHAAAAAPRRTGTLAASVRGNRAAARSSIAAGGARVPYAGPIHWGWPARNIAAQPFITDTAARLEPQWTAMLDAEIDASLAKVKGA